MLVPLSELDHFLLLMMSDFHLFCFFPIQRSNKYARAGIGPIIFITV